jgi:Arc/MetJ family transcription regulator
MEPQYAIGERRRGTGEGGPVTVASARRCIRKSIVRYRISTSDSGILRHMRTTIDVDKSALDAASKVLGTKTLKDTVNAALGEVIASAKRRNLIERIEQGSLPTPSPTELARLRAPKLQRGALSAKRRGR